MKAYIIEVRELGRWAPILVANSRAEADAWIKAQPGRDEYHIRVVDRL